jgi:hypothetical protein
MIVAIHQPHYLPWLRYLHKIALCDVFVLLDDAQYTKNGWQNRNRIKGPNGALLLTVPLHAAAFRPIGEVEINPQTAWREKHWRSIVQSYGKARYFHQHRETFERIYASEWGSLAALNLGLLRALTQAFGISTQVVASSDLGIPGQGTDRLVGLCRRLGASHYLTGAFAVGHHLDAESFTDAGITLSVQAWVCPGYQQQFPHLGFIPELSAIDLLFNEGPRSFEILMNRHPHPVPGLVAPVSS